MKNEPKTPSPLTFGAIGDSYGFCFEFAPADFVAQYNDLEYHQHPEFAEVPPGVYSDDTQMQLAIAELIVSGSDWTPELIADHFVRVFRRDPRAGYAKRFRSLLNQVNTGAELLARIEPTSDRNGAAMRAPVIGLIDDLSVVIDYATKQAAITHNTEGGIDSAVAAAIICHFFVYGLGSKEDLPAFLSEHLPRHPWAQPWSGPVPCHGISTIQAVVTSLLATDSLSDLLRRSVAFTGDVDSVATIACACASVSPYFKKDIPDSLWDGIETSAYGIRHLLEMDRKVWQCVTRTAG